MPSSIIISDTYSVQYFKREQNSECFKKKRGLFLTLSRKSHDLAILFYFLCIKTCTKFCCKDSPIFELSQYPKMLIL